MLRAYASRLRITANIDQAAISQPELQPIKFSFLIHAKDPSDRSQYVASILSFTLCGSPHGTQMRISSGNFSARNGPDTRWPACSRTASEYQLERRTSGECRNAAGSLVRHRAVAGRGRRRHEDVALRGSRARDQRRICIGVGRFLPNESSLHPPLSRRCGNGATTHAFRGRVNNVSRSQHASRVAAREPGAPPASAFSARGAPFLLPEHPSRGNDQRLGRCSRRLSFRERLPPSETSPSSLSSSSLLSSPPCMSCGLIFCSAS
jgi:hypothetical protein